MLLFLNSRVIKILFIIYLLFLQMDCCNYVCVVYDMRKRNGKYEPSKILTESPEDLANAQKKRKHQILKLNWRLPVQTDLFLNLNPKLNHTKTLNIIVRLWREISLGGVFQW